MFLDFFKKKRDRRNDPDWPSIPPGEVVYAIGDIHGCYDIIQNMHQMIAKDAEKIAPNIKKTIVYLGDYVDRGPDSNKVLDILVDHPLKNFNKIFLKGNHEEALIEFLHNSYDGPEWLKIGGEACLYSYQVQMPIGAAEKEKFFIIRETFRENFPREHLRFLKSLKLSYELGDYFFVHAGIKPGMPLSKQRPRDMLWIRNEFTESGKFHGKIIVHGHTISKSKKPSIHSNRIGLDTGAYATGTLSCLRIEGGKRRLLISKRRPK